MDQRQGGLDNRRLLIDGLAYAFDGYSENVAASGATALNVTVPDPDDNFQDAMVKVLTAVRIASSHPNLRVVYSASDITEARAQGQTGIIIGFQESLPFGTDLDRIWMFAHVGVRVVQLTYNFRNFVGDGCLEDPDGGLSRFGRRVIRELDSAGVIVDLSHAGSRTALEAVELGEKPPVVSHAGAAAVVHNPRNLSDAVIDAVAARGGVLGCCCWGPMCWLGGDDFTVEDLVRHIEYVAGRVGVDHVGISTDSACTTDVASTQIIAERTHARYPEVTGPFVSKFGIRIEARYPKGLCNLRELATLPEVLSRHGFGQEDVAKILGGNFLRVFRAVWGPQ